MRSSILSALAFTAPLLLSACGDDGAVVTPRSPVSLDAGGVTVRVDPDALRITLLRGDTELLSFPADGIELGAVSALDDGFNYDPYSLFVPSALQPPPDGLAWLQLTAIDAVSEEGNKLVVPLTFTGGKRGKLSFEASAAGRFRAELVPESEGAPIAYLRFRPRADALEGFYGLGEHFDDVNQRGKIRAMQIELDSEIESQYNEVHVPIPLLIGSKGFGLYVESAYPGVFSVAVEEDDLVDVTYGTGLSSTDGLVFHLIAEEKPIDVTRHYYELTGYPRLPARFALGPWVWRDENKDQAEVEADVQAMRDLDLAATGYWIDRPYATAVNTFDFNPAQFADAKAMIDKMHALGLRTALWHTPYLDEKDAATASLRDEASSKGYYPKTVGVLLNKWGKPIDLTNPEAFAWWQGHIQAYTSMGVEGFKLDYGEDVVAGIVNGRNVWEFADGSDERTMHQRFQLSYHQVYAETLPSEGGFLLCRHATAGDQTNGTIIWPGDLDASFAKHRETVMESGGGSYIAVGGLPAAVVASVSLGPSGFPFFGSDTGGYRHSPPDKELFVRWFEHTALSTVMQVGNSANTVPWEPDPQTGYDAEMLDWYRRYARLHLRLFPYEWTYAERIAQGGRPIQRPLGLAYPELGLHPSDEYLFGEDLLVAPVIERGVTERDVLFPPGRWVDWWTGEVVEGGKSLRVAAPLDTLPLYIREGAIIPMLRPTIDTLAPTTLPLEVDSYATTPGLLYARVAAGEKQVFTLFDGAELSAERGQGTISLSSKDGAEFKYGVVFELVGLGTKPSAVSEGGAALQEEASLAALEAAASGWVFVSETGGTVYVKLPAGAHVVDLSGI